MKSHLFHYQIKVLQSFVFSPDLVVKLFTNPGIQEEIITFELFLSMFILKNKKIITRSQPI